MTIRRACSALQFDRSAYHYRSRRTDPAVLKKRIKEICETHVRYGYRRVYYILRRDGWTVNMKKVYRLYREQGLQLRNKTPKRRVKAKLREDRAPAIRPNDVWAMDFVHDQLATGRKLRILTVVDTFSRLSPVVDPRFSYRGEDVVATLETACRKIGYPWTVVPVERRRDYMAALEQASVREDIVPFARFLGALVDQGMQGAPLPSVPETVAP